MDVFLTELQHCVQVYYQFVLQIWTRPEQIYVFTTREATTAPQ